MVMVEVMGGAVGGGGGDGWMSGWIRGCINACTLGRASTVTERPACECAQLAFSICMRPDCACPHNHNHAYMIAIAAAPTHHSIQVGEALHLSGRFGEFLPECIAQVVGRVRTDDQHALPVLGQLHSQAA